MLDHPEVAILICHMICRQSGLKGRLYQRPLAMVGVKVSDVSWRRVTALVTDASDRNARAKEMKFRMT